jgi:tRNA modification GTPase
VAVVRLSGPGVRAALEAIVEQVPPARRAALLYLRDNAGEPIDQGLVLFFPGPASFSGEDCAEFHVHGGKAVVEALLRRLGEMPGLRQAEAGEFTRRAFLNGKIDLTGAEGLADLIAAETEAQRRLALDNAQGGQRELYASWRQRLLHARAMIEAELDFADEAEVPGSVSHLVLADLAALGREIDTHIDSYRAAEIVRDGFRVVLVGAPNAGKSSLINALARREVAIVTEIAGTTRDLIETSLNIEGMKIIVTDTAGIRATDDMVERIGVERALDAAAGADLILELIDASNPLSATPVALRVESPMRLRIATKIDAGESTGGQFDERISAVTGEGLDGLIAAIAEKARHATACSGRIAPTRLRQIELLRRARVEIDTALSQTEMELQAEHLRFAGDALGRITGAIDVEEVLGVIFSEFCIGK